MSKEYKSKVVTSIIGILIFLTGIGVFFNIWINSLELKPPTVMVSSTEEPFIGREIRGIQSDSQALFATTNDSFGANTYPPGLPNNVNIISYTKDNFIYLSEIKNNQEVMLHIIPSSATQLNFYNNKSISYLHQGTINYLNPRSTVEAINLNDNDLLNNSVAHVFDTFLFSFVTISYTENNQIQILAINFDGSTTTLFEGELSTSFQRILGYDTSGLYISDRLNCYQIIYNTKTIVEVNCSEIETEDFSLEIAGRDYQFTDNIDNETKSLNLSTDQYPFIKFFRNTNNNFPYMFLSQRTFKSGFTEILRYSFETNSLEVVGFIAENSNEIKDIFEIDNQFAVIKDNQLLFLSLEELPVAYPAELEALNFYAFQKFDLDDVSNLQRL